MSQTIAYRLTVFAGTLYSNTTTALTPASGSSHSGSFQVASVTGVSGFEPFLTTPSGQQGAYNFENGTTTKGTYNVTILDKKVGATGGNLERFVSAFIGNENAQLHLIGRKALLEEYDGTTWSPLFVGKVNRVSLASPLEFTLELGDPGYELTQKIFSIKPRVSYAVYKSLLPLGLLDSLTSTSGSVTDRITGGIGFPVSSSINETNRRILRLKNDAITSPANFYPYGSDDSDGSPFQPGTTTGVGNGMAPLRAQVTISGVEYHYVVDKMERLLGYTKTSGNSPITRIAVKELPTNDPDYAPLSALVVNSATTVIVYRVLNDTADGIATMWLPATPYTIFRDVLDGKYFQSGSNTLVVPYDSGTLAALEAAQPLPNTIYRINEGVEAKEFIEAECRRFALGYTYDPVINGGVAQAQIRFFSTLQPASLAGLQTIDGSDLDATGNKEWEAVSPIYGVVGRYYMETYRNLSRDSLGTNITPEIDVTTETQYPIIIVPDGSNTIDASLAVDDVDFAGLRGLNNNYQTLGDDAVVFNLPSHKYMSGQALKWLSAYYNRRKYGNPIVTLTLVRNANTKTMKVGDFVLVELDVLPNQSVRQRGGTRVMQILQKSPDGIRYQVQLVDAGVSATMNTPTLGTVTAPNPSQVSFSVTTNQDANVEIEYAAVPSGGSAPSSASTQWTMAYVRQINNTSTTVTIEGLPNGRKIFVRIRSTSPTNGELRLPSPWSTSAGTEISWINAPSGLTASNVNSRSAVLNWTDTESGKYDVEVWTCAPASTTPTQHITKLPAGSTTYWLKGLHKDSATSHTSFVRFIDGKAGFSPFASASFNATGSAPQLDEPAAILVYESRL